MLIPNSLHKFRKLFYKFAPLLFNKGARVIYHSERYIRIFVKHLDK